MTIGKVISLVLGIIFLVIAVIYLVSPATIGGSVEAGEMMPQSGMWGNTIAANFTSIPLGVGSLTVPVSSAVLIFFILGAALVYGGLAKSRKEVESET